MQEIDHSIDEFIEGFSTEDASSVVVLMSHGADDFIYGSDIEKVHIPSIVDKFKPNKCPALQGKPKLFFIQACRGRK